MVRFKVYFLHRIPLPSQSKNKTANWLSPNGDKKTWIKVGEASDFKGLKWGESKDLCGGEPYQVYAWGAAGVVIKWYGGHIDFKWWSVREIDPSGIPIL